MRTGESDDIVISAVDGGGLPAHLAEQVDAIFFETSGRSGFASPEERMAFRERWLGRYLADGSDVVLIAQSPEGAVAGYLVGALKDPAEQERFADIGYFRAAFRDLCRRYPAHLHINLAQAYRGRGIGACLIAAFAARAVAAGAPGFHVVTAKDARNVPFYRRCGLGVLGTTCWNGREVVFLGKALEAPGPALTRR
ncbi:MAG TPA: GNAT family N-acetyltransferase [Hyphomicrobiaceae bacterium]|jgi:GNAT superfamily N-acetyltransferase